VSWTAVIFLLSTVLAVSSDLVGIYEVGNNCVNPTHCCVFSHIKWVAYSFLLLPH